MKLSGKNKDHIQVVQSASDQQIGSALHHEDAVKRNQWFLIVLPALILVAVGIVIYAKAAVNETVFTASSDTYVKEREPAATNGDRDQLVVSGQTTYRKNAYMRFSVKGIGTKKVDKATLRFKTLQETSSKVGDIYMIPAAANAPALKSMTWNTQPSLDGAVRVGTIGAVAANTWYDIPLSATSWPDGSYLLAIIGVGNDSVRIASRESADKPQLKISLASTPPPVTPPTVTLSASPGTVELNNSVVLTWSATNAPTSCTAGGSWSGTKASSGSETSIKLTAEQSYAFTLSCTNAGGTGQASTSVVAKAAVVSSGGAVSVPTGAYFGARSDFNYSSGDLAHMTMREGQIGRKYDHERIFFTAGQWKTVVVASSRIKQASDAGRIPMVSFKLSTTEWSQVPTGSLNADIDDLATQIKNYGKPMWLTFGHEPDGDGDATAYANMWRYMYDRFKAKGVTNVSWNWITTSYSFKSSAGAARNQDIKNMYPGDAYVDWIMADPYNFIDAGNGLCPKWRNDPTLQSNWDKKWVSLGNEMQDWYNWAAQHGKPLGIAEWGVLDDPRAGKETRRAEWISQAQNDVKTKFPKIKAMTYFDTVIDGDSCNWRITEGSLSQKSVDATLAAYRGMALDTYFNPNKR